MACELEYVNIKFNEREAKNLKKVRTLQGYKVIC